MAESTFSDQPSNLLASLSLQDKVLLVSGADAWHTPALPAAGVPSLKVSDGPNGVRGNNVGGMRSACFPSGICMGSTFNPALVERLGQAVATEAKRKGVDVVLGPTINLHRTPLGGRNFECYSEDPVLSGALATAFVTGVQSQGVGACPKHLVANDSEFQRHSISSEIDQRTLRELYLRPFEMVVRRARPWMIMSAYNRLNGIFACSNAWLNNTVLRGQWGFDGVVVSDWYAALETEANALGGLDLEMPGPSRVWGEHLLAAITSGAVPAEVLDQKVLHLLQLAERSGRLANPDRAPETSVDDPNDRALAREIAQQGMVLLRNNGVLPLQLPKLRSIAVIGPNAAAAQIMGGGSAQVASHPASLPLDALAAHLGDGCSLVQEPGVFTEKFCPAPERSQLHSADDPARQGLDVVAFDGHPDQATENRRFTTGNNSIHLGGLNGQDSASSATVRGSYTAATGGHHVFGMNAAGCAQLRVDGKLLIDINPDTPAGDAFFGFSSQEIRAGLELTAGQQVDLAIDFQNRPEVRVAAFRYGIIPPRPADAFDRAVAAAAAADAVILLCGTSPEWETEGNDRSSMDLPGGQDRLISTVAAANPNTVLVLNTGAHVAMPWLEDVPAVLQAWFPGEEFGNALVDLLFGAVSPSGRMPTTIPRRLQDTPAFTSYPGEFGQVHYGERMFIGYRWYDARDITPAVPFGHGLSYTTFDYRQPAVSAGDPGHFQITVDISNCGDMAGAEVVQLYLAPCDPEVQQPLKELRGFCRLELPPGATGSATFSLEPRDFCTWQPDQGHWHAPAGAWRILLGASSRDIRAELQVALQQPVTCPA